MAPLLALTGLFTLFSLLDLGWWSSLRYALAGMFLLTASAHWGRRRPDLIRMVPPVFPRPDLLVSTTGILEIAGAAGLCVPALAPYAAIGLVGLLIALFPANVYAARLRLTIGGQPVLPLIPRALMQTAFIAALIAVSLRGPLPPRL